MFRRATKTKSKLRMLLTGPAGSGKTYSALSIASHLGSKVAVIDTEHGSSAKYSDQFVFDICEITAPYSPKKYIEAISEAERNYDVLIIDSLSHAWAGEGGVLDEVDKIAERTKKSSFNAWRDGTKMQNQLVEKLLSCKCHLIATARTKTEYAIEQENGKSKPKKIGTAPVQREQLDYEFDVVGEITLEHTLIISKTRISTLTDLVMDRPGKNLATMLKDWLENGVSDEATEQQVVTMTDLALSLGEKAVSYCAGRLEEGLTMAQAEEIINKLKKKIEEKKHDK